jgi:hypothetical protein
MKTHGSAGYRWVTVAPEENIGAKTKGKEPEVVQPTVISEGEFGGDV